MTKTLLAATFLLICALELAPFHSHNLARADWPQFLGPGRTGISTESVKLATTWPTEGPKTLWTAKVGPGWCGVAVVANEVFLLDRERDQQDVLRCLSLTDGSELWRYAYDAPGQVQQNGSRSTPAVDDKYVFTVGPFGDFLCVDRKTHQPLWRKHLLKDFNANMPDYAVSQSPLLQKDTVIVAPCGRSAGLAALKKDSGEVAWKSEPCGTPWYTSATPMTIDSVDQIVAYGDTGRGTTTVLSVDAATGNTLWKYPWRCDTPIASPLHVGGGKVFLTAGYKSGSAMAQVTKDGDTWSAKTLWRLTNQQCGSQIHNPLLWNDHLFVDNNENGKNNGMVCVALDGTIAWSSKTPNCKLGGQILADGMLYKLDGTQGILYLVDPSPDSFKILAQAKVLNKGELWAPLVISAGKLILRDARQIKCLDVQAR